MAKIVKLIHQFRIVDGTIQNRHLEGKGNEIWNKDHHHIPTFLPDCVHKQVNWNDLLVLLRHHP